MIMTVYDTNLNSTKVYYLYLLSLPKHNSQIVKWAVREFQGMEHDEDY